MRAHFAFSIQYAAVALIISLLSYSAPFAAYASTIYSENFSGTAGTHLEVHENHWVRNPGNPYIDLNGDNTAGVVGETHYWWNSTQSTEQDIKFDFKAHTTAGRNYYGIMHRENGGDGSFTNEQVYMEIYSDLSGQIFNTDHTTEYSFPTGYFTEGQWYTLRSTYDNNDNVTVYLNNSLLAQWHSSRTAFAKGSFGLNIMNGTIRNLTYTGNVSPPSVQGITLFSDDFTDTNYTPIASHNSNYSFVNVDRSVYILNNKLLASDADTQVIYNVDFPQDICMSLTYQFPLTIPMYLYFRNNGSSFVGAYVEFAYPYHGTSQFVGVNNGQSFYLGAFTTHLDSISSGDHIFKLCGQGATLSLYLDNTLLSSMNVDANYQHGGSIRFSTSAAAPVDNLLRTSNSLSKNGHWRCLCTEPSQGDSALRRTQIGFP